MRGTGSRADVVVVVVVVELDYVKCAVAEEEEGASFVADQMACSERGERVPGFDDLPGLGAHGSYW